MWQVTVEHCFQLQILELRTDSTVRFIANLIKEIRVSFQPFKGRLDAFLAVHKTLEDLDFVLTSQQSNNSGLAAAHI